MNHPKLSDLKKAAILFNRNSLCQQFELDLRVIHILVLCEVTCVTTSPAILSWIWVPEMASPTCLLIDPGGWLVGLGIFN